MDKHGLVSNEAHLGSSSSAVRSKGYIWSHPSIDVTLKQSVLFFMQEEFCRAAVMGERPSSKHSRSYTCRRDMTNNSVSI